MCATAFFLLLVGLVVYYAAKKGTKPPAAAVIGLFLAGSGAALAQCPGGVCPAPGRSGFVSFGQPYLQVAPIALGQQQYKWLKHETAADNWVLWLGNQHVGTYRSDQGLYYPWLGTKFGDGQKTAPVSPPTEAGQPVEDFGMGWRPSGQDKWTAKDGKQITATAAARDLVDDSGRKFIVGVLDKSQGDALKKDWQAGAGEFREQYHLQVLDSGSPIASQRGYSQGVYVIGADGKQLAKSDSYTGPDGLLDVLKKLRDGGGIGPLISPQLNVPTWVWVTGILLAGYYFGKRSK